MRHYERGKSLMEWGRLDKSSRALVLAGAACLAQSFSAGSAEHRDYVSSNSSDGSSSSSGRGGDCT